MDRSVASADVEDHGTTVVVPSSAPAMLVIETAGTGRVISEDELLSPPNLVPVVPEVWGRGV